MKERIIILGAGVAGLSAAYFLTKSGRHDVTVLENSDKIGGMCASFSKNGFTLDFGPHKMYSTIPGILDELVALMGDRIHRLPKKNRIFLNGSYLEYPLKLGNLLSVMGPWLFMKISLGFSLEKCLGFIPREEAGSYAVFMSRTFGGPAYRLIFEPLADKVWGDPESLHPDMARIRVPALNTRDLILRILKLKSENENTSASFFYYPRKGFGDFPDRLREEIEKNGGKILTGTILHSIGQKDNAINRLTFTVNGQKREISCDRLISSIPLGHLADYLFPDSAGQEHLAARNLILVYIFVDQPKVLEDHWVFFPEKKFVFSRLSEQKNMSEGIGPAESTVLCCDLTCEENSDIWSLPSENVIATCISQLADAGIIKDQNIIRQDCFVIRKPHFYPRYDLNYLEKINRMTGRLKKIINLIPTGRLGMFNYNNSDHCFDMGKFIARGLSQNQACGEIWDSLEKHVRSYKIVD